MFRNMVTSLFKYDRIRTTDAKAKELRGWADRIVTLAKRGDLHARRQALSIIREQAVVHKLFDEAPERFGGIEGGYTRVIKLGRRPGDAAPMSMIELVAGGQRRTPKPAKAKTAEAPEAPAAAPVAVPSASETAAPAADAADESLEAAAPEAMDAPETESAPAEAAAPEAEEAAPEVKGEDAPETETKTEEK
jgi:large subunit ribosomal protein L17